MKKVLVFGSSGYVGQEFVNQLHQKGNVVICAPSHKSLSTMSDVYKLIRNISPNQIYNAAGYTGKQIGRAHV